MSCFAIRWFAALMIVVAAGGRMGRAEEALPRFLTRSWQSEDGLPGNAVRSVVQARDGYLWVATAEGVVRFDGVRFSGFDAPPDRALARLPARSLYPLPDGSVWIATTRNGLLRWDGRRLAAILPETDAAGPVWQVLPAGADVVVLYGADVLRVAPDGSSRVVPRTLELDALLSADAQFWAAHGRDTQAPQIPQLRDRRGRIWRALPAGLTVSRSPEGEPVPLAGARVRCLELLEDREGNLWAATANKGLLCLSEAKVRMITDASGLSDQAPRAFLEDRSGAVWIGTKKGGMDCLRGEKITHFDLGESFRQKTISALYEDRAGTLWVGTRDGGIARRVGEGFESLAAPLALSRISAIIEDAQGHLFFGGKSGLATLAEGALQPVNPGPGVDLREISALAADESGALWVGTNLGGLFRGKDGQFTAVAGTHCLEHRGVSSLLPDRDGVLWVTTLGAGLLRWEGGRFTCISTEEGLPDPRLTCALDDRFGHLWIGSLAGIFRIDKAELTQLAHGQRTRASVLVIDRSDGLLSRECTAGFQPSGFRLRDGSIGFSTAQGLAFLEPDQLRLPTAVPPVFIEECRANGRALDPRGGSVESGPGRVHLEFRYTALSFTAPGKVKFQVQLEGLENEWRDTGGQRSISYEAVPPGHYRFRVLAASGDGVWNQTGAALAVVVRPHFWETPWFQTLLAVGAVLLVAAIVLTFERVRTKQRLLRLEADSAKQAERMRIARDLHDDLGSRLTEISLLAGYASDDPAGETRAGQALPEIFTKTRALAAALDEIVWAVNPRHDTVTSLVEYLAAFFAEYLATARIVARFDLSPDLPAARLDPERRHSIFLAVREALNNAVKYSRASEVWLRVRFDAGTLHLIVQDNGAGFDPAAVKGGEGLRNMAARLESLGGVFRLESSPVGGGARAHFEVPMNVLPSDQPRIE